MQANTLVRDIFLGATLAASAVGIVGTAAAQDKPLEGDLQTQSIKTERFTGALAGAEAPKIDGPVRWERNMCSEESLNANQILNTVGAAGVSVLFGGAIGAAVGVAFSPGKYEKAGTHAGAMLGAVIAATSIGSLTYHTSDDGSRIVEFPTTVASIEAIGESHLIFPPKGSPYGPFFPGLITIPESTLPLAVDSHQAPFVPGQKIVARFKLDGDGQIESWIAFPGLRDRGEK